MGNSGTINIKIVVDGQGGIKVLKEVGDESQKTGKKGEKAFADMEKSSASLGTSLLKIGAALGGMYALKRGFDITTEAASSLNETVNKSDTIFGANAAEIRKWSESSATALGMSKQAALENAATLGNMFKQLGAGGDTATRSSQQMIKLATDLASFHNVAGGATQVLEGMQAAFRGEYDSLQRYIPTIKAASVEQQALAMTGKESTKELTDLEKALAAQAIMMRDAGDAVGDFAKTSGDLANQERILEAQIKDAEAAIGQGLLPVKKEIVKQMSAWITANKDFIAGDLKGYLENLLPVVKGLMAGIGGVAKFMNMMGIGLAQAAARVAGYVDAVEEAANEQYGLAKSAAETAPKIKESTAAIEQQKQAVKALSKEEKDAIVLNKKIWDEKVKTAIQGDKEMADAYADYSKYEIKLMKDQQKEEKKLHEDSIKLMESELNLKDRLLSGMMKKDRDYFTFKKTMLDNELKKYKGMYGDLEYIKKAFAERYKQLEWEQAEASEDFFAGLKAGYDQIIYKQKTLGQVGSQVAKDLHSAFSSSISSQVNLFVRGEQAKIDIARAAGDAIVASTSHYASEMYEKAIDQIVNLIGALIGQMAAGGGASGAMKGGVWGALAEIGVTLGSGVAAMLAGRAMANQFRASGGWIETHPGGGWINQGSGTKDDVFLGHTPGVRHWGMGGEFVVNKSDAASAIKLLHAINTGSLSDRHLGWAGGGYLPQEDDTRWNGTADALVLGTLMSAAHGFYKGGPFGALAEAIMFNATAIPAMFVGKLAGNKFFKDGGPIDVGYGFGSFFSSILSPIHKIISADPIGKKIISPVYKTLFGILPHELADYLPEDPYTVMERISDPEFIQEILKKMLRTPYEQIAKDLLTPGRYTSNPIDTVSTMLNGLNDVTKAAFGMKKTPLDWFHDGTDFVPRTGVYHLDRGERVVDADTNRQLSRAGGDSHELIAEIRALRADLQAGTYAIARSTGKMAKILDKFDGDGMPAVRS